MNSVKITSSSIYLHHFMESIQDEVRKDMVEPVHIVDARYVIDQMSKNKKVIIKERSLVVDLEFGPYLIYFYNRFSFKGILLGNYSVEDHVRAVIKVSNDSFFVKSGLLKKIYDKEINNTYEILERLTKTEVKIIRLTMQNLSNPEIAELMKCSVRTVENHKYRIFRKLDIKSSVQLAQILQNYAPWIMADEI